MQEQKQNETANNDFNFGDKSFDERENAQMINTNMGVIKRF